ncbi:MAG: amidohydrolase [Acidimicrobiia bacterium]|nr:MAG: amidohydrolase [Acidimicrobiia bacterium]
MPVIDVHCHLATPQTREKAAPHFRPEYEPYDFFMGEESKAHNSVMLPAIAPYLTEPGPRIEKMDEMGVDIQGLATFVSEYFYWVPPRLGHELARIQNDRLAQVVADHPNRFAPFGATLPMQDVDRTLEELDRVVNQLGFKGVQIGAHVDGHDLDEARFAPFFEAAEELGIVIILHPSGYPDGRHLDRYFLTNCIGNPLATMVAVTRLIFAGVFERHPGLKMLLLHGGGYAPFYAARADHTWKVRPETRTHIPEHPPSHYLKRLYFDTVVFQPLYLRHLLDVVGADRVMLGTDFPFDMGEEDPVGLVSQVEGLDEDARAAILGGNAAKVFGLEEAT